jgi:hypothetical protein
LRDLRVVYPGGHTDVARVAAGDEAILPIRLVSESKVRVEIGGRRYVEWGYVRGGSRPRLVIGP